MDYAEARRVLDRLPRFEVKPGLSRIERLLERLGRPERCYPAVHVAGTNGKGSVVAMIDAVLRRAGYRTGRFTSPELIDFRDRIAIGGSWLSEEGWADGVDRIRDALGEATDPPTAFEATAAVAFDTFARSGIDLAIVEVGLGGRFDATNLARPIVSVLTNVSIDHQEVLGGTIADIAWEKAGIAKPDVPMVYGELSVDAEAVVRGECERVGAPAIPAAALPVARVNVNWKRARYRIDRAGLPAEVDLGLLGGYQRDNLRLVLGAIEQLRRRGIDVPDVAVREGLAAAHWPGRFEVVRRHPHVVLEGAHNVAGAQRLAEDIELFVPAREKRHLLLGVLADKDAEGIGRALGGAFDRAFLCASSSDRALPVQRLYERIGGLFERAIEYDAVVDALEDQLPALSPGDALVVAGSLTVVSEARRWLEEVG